MFFITINILWKLFCNNQMHLGLSALLWGQQQVSYLTEVQTDKRLILCPGGFINCRIKCPVSCLLFSWTVSLFIYQAWIMKNRREVTTANVLREHETARECLKVQDIPSFTLHIGFMVTAEATESVNNSVIWFGACLHYYGHPASYGHRNKT